MKMSFVAKLLANRTWQQSEPCLTCMQAMVVVRWRKPRHIPRAKSKEFVVRQPTPQTKEDKEILKIWWDHYHTKMKTLRTHLVNVYLESLEEDKKRQIDRTEEKQKEWERMFEENARWNARIQPIREKRQLAEDAVKEREIKRITKLREKRAAKLHQAAVERILYEKQQAAHFITPDNVDVEVEKLLGSIKNYDFAVELSGKIIEVEDDDDNLESVDPLASSDGPPTSDSVDPLASPDGPPLLDSDSPEGPPVSPGTS